MTGIGPEFLKLLRGIEWDTLTARDAVDLRAALKEAVDHSDEWFQNLTREFREKPGEVEIIKSPSPPPAKVEDGRPQVKVSPPRVPKPGASTKRKRGRPLPVKQRPNPIVIGGANAETPGEVRAAQLFENSYVSKEGPRADIPAALPADHPRLNPHRETSVTPEQDVADFRAVEKALATGRGVTDIFQVK